MSLLGHLGLLAAIGGWPSGSDDDVEFGAVEEGAILRVSLACPLPVPVPAPVPAPVPLPLPLPPPPARTSASAPAHCLTRIDPVYPPPCLRRGHQGRCLLAIDISAAGRATGVVVLRSSGCPDLDAAAVAAARAASYQSARDHGRTVASRLELAVRFVLN